MEIHLAGLPEHLMEDALKQRLMPFMGKLGIPDHAFVCDKPRLRKWANVTFADSKQGDAFLQAHGQQLIGVHAPPPSSGGRRPSNASAASFGSRQPHAGHQAFKQARPQRKARLKLMGIEIFCSLSKSSNDPSATARAPDPITLRSLQYAAEEKANPTRKIKTDGAPEVFHVVSFSCGHNVFDGERLVYIPEVEFNDTGTAKFSKQALLIKMRSRHIIKIPLATVVDLLSSYRHILTITLSEEPSFFIDANASVDAGALGDLFMQLDLKRNGGGRGNEPTRHRVCSLNQEHAQVVGQCLVYQFHIDGNELDRQLLTLKNHDVIPFARYNLSTQRTAPLELGPSRTAMRSLMQELAGHTSRQTLPFGILFQLQALAWNAYLHPGLVLSLTRRLHAAFQSDKATGKRPISVEAMKKLFMQIDWARPHGDPSDFKVDSFVTLLRRNEDEIRKAALVGRGLFAPTQSQALVHRATVTPSRITLHGPELEAKNRILRRFPNHHEYFVRVQFCDENGQDLFFNANISYEEVYAKFKRVLRDGIQIAGRTYTFLGFSHSSLRSHSAWFSAPFVDDNENLQSYFTIISALGMFSHIRSPAKCAARIGQAFSETQWSLSLNDYNIRVSMMDDVKSSDETRVFSDGVGTLSWDVVHHIWQIIPRKMASPTAFQIRFKGCKGMLALDSTLHGSIVLLRPSMMKFPSQDRPDLEICDVASKPIPLVLNRQMIKILEDMGVDAEWFLDMQALELQRLRTVTSDAYNVADFLKQQNVGEGMRLHRLFRQAKNMGVDYRKDGFLCSIVTIAVLRELRLLKHKARIPIREGITLYGIMDETGFLKENEVYVTYDTMGRFAPPPPDESPLLVTRSPALHPGDVQLAKQVVPPNRHPLRDHCNVIVFSRHGSRDLPSQLSGGDLDGDIYNVIWDEAAMPRHTFAPADYPRVEPLDLGREVTKEDMADFFVDFMKLDHLGIIATRHMILADQEEQGTLHPDCLRLAALHSTAVDFSKTGIPVDFRELPKARKFRPDFLAPGPQAHVMEKSKIDFEDHILEEALDEEEDQFSGPRYKYYKSDKILGRLYRVIDEKKVFDEDIKPKAQPAGASFWDEFLKATGSRYEALVENPGDWIYHRGSAREIRGLYEDAIRGAMYSYSEHPVRPLRELEVVVGNVNNKSGTQSNRQRDKSIKLKEEFDRIVGWITTLMRKVNHDPDAVLTGYQTKLDSLHLCLACVHVGCEERARNAGSESMELQSFKVVAACALLSELNSLEGGLGGGGYVGVRGGRSTRVQPGKGAFSRVPPP